MEEFIGIIKLFAGNFAPRGWMLCQGQILPVSQYNAVFSILGSTYGGNGQTTFALPDLRSRIPIGTGQGPGLQSYVQGQMAGQEKQQITPQNVPQLAGNATLTGLAGTASGTVATSSAANIKIPCSNNPSDKPDPEGNVFASDSMTPSYTAIPESGKFMQPFSADLPLSFNASLPVTINNSTAPVTVNLGGGSLPVSIVQPYLALNYIICVEGLYPTRP